MSALSDLVGKVIFLICSSDENISEKFAVTESFEEVDEMLAKMDVDSDLDIIPRVLYGVLASAENIPVNLHNKIPYIIAEDPTNRSSILVSDALISSNEEITKRLAETIQGMINGDSPQVMTFVDTSIDNVFVLYGNLMKLGYTIDIKGSYGDIADTDAVKLISELNFITKRSMENNNE